MVGDPPDAIASGPTAPDPTTFAGAWAALDRYDLAERVPAPVRDRLVKGRVYLWTVTARDKDSNLLTSGSASFVVE